MDPKAAAAKSWRQMRQAAVIVNGGIVLFAGINLYKGSDKFYEQIVMPLFRLVGPETAHNVSIKLAKYKLVPRPLQADPPSLSSKVWGRSFPNPVGLAAGYDKQGEAVDGLLKMGFGFVEVGSITPEPQPGNDKPRVFRLIEDRAVINRYGFNSDGHEVVYERLAERHRPQETVFFSSQVVAISKGVGLLGVNLGKNKTSPDAVGDYVKGVHKFGGLADYLVVNVSSPNTPGLRSMQKRDELAKLLFGVLEARNKLSINPKPPLLVKIAPDLDDEQKKDIAAVVLDPKTRVDGMIISNTTVARPESLQSSNKTETGGLSGAPLTSKSLETIRDMYTLTQGQLPIVGVGGVSNGQEAYDKVKAGASLIQIYTAMLYKGPPVIAKIKREMDELLRQDGFTHISQAVGIEAKAPQKSAKSV